VAKKLVPLNLRNKEDLFLLWLNYYNYDVQEALVNLKQYFE